MGQKFNHLLIEDVDTLEKYLEQFNPELEVFNDTETTSLSWEAMLLGISLYQIGVWPAFIAVRTPFFNNRGIPLHELRPVINKFLQRCRKHIFHNAKFDLGVYQANGFEEPNVVADTLLEIHMYNADLKKNLEERVKTDFGYSKKKLKDFISPETLKENKSWFKLKNGWPAEWTRDIYKVISLEMLAEYASEDVYWTEKIHRKYAPLVIEHNVQEAYSKIELPLLHLLKDMKAVGVEIDLDFLETLRAPCEQAILTIEKEVHEMAGCIFNINSGKQLGEVLYEKMGYKCKYYTETGQPQTNKTAMKDLKFVQKAPIADLLINHSKLTSLYDGFIKSIPKWVSSDGRLRGDFNSEGARTGRFSSSNPNLQNQANNKQFPIRAAYVPKKGYKFVILDWSQIELRVAAHLSRDKRMMQAFIDGRDIHQEVADQLGITRKDAKAVNFGILYGLGAPSLAEYAEVSLEYAENMLNGYKATYTGLIGWEREVEHRAHIKGHVRTMFGRVRPLGGFKSGNKELISKAKRQAVNTLIQGTSADLMKIGMLKIYNWFKKDDIDAAILLTVHDELVIEVREDIANMVYWKCKEMMENITPMRVPIIAEGKICDNWFQGKDDDFKGYQYEQYSSNSGIEPWMYGTILNVG